MAGDIVCVLGAGTMGRGIAHVCALSGFDTRLRDLDAKVLTAARDQIAANLDKGVKLGKVSQTAATATLARLHFDTDLGAAARDAAWIIEAVPEDLALKQRVLAEAERHAGDAAVLATNTSSLSITKIQSALAKPARVVGLHFFNPAHLLPLLEVVVGDRTQPSTVDAAVAFARRLGKEPILVRDSPGFASSRLGIVLGLEAIRMVEQGVASAADIDKAMELGYSHPMGPLKLTDLVGLDVRLAIAEHLHHELKADQYRPPDLLRRMVAEGRLGKKSGRGFYEYAAKS